MEAPSAAALVRDLAEDITPVDLCRQVAALAAEQRPRLCDSLKQNHHFRIQSLQHSSKSILCLSTCEDLCIGVMI